MSTVNSTFYQLDDIFYAHKNTLWRQRRQTEEALEDWYQSLKERIDNYRSDQKKMIDVAYEKQSEALKKLQEQAVEEYRICFRRQDNQQIKDLIERCRKIQIQLMLSNTVLKQETYLALEQAKEITLMDDEPLIDRTENRSASNVTSNSVYTSSSAYNDFGPTSYPNSNAAERNQSMNSSTVMNKGIENDIDPKNCLVCFMEFPPTMSRIQKQLHIEKHFDS